MTRSYRLALAFASCAVALSGCGGAGNSTVTVGEYQLNPKSALFYSYPDHSTVVIVSDQTDICAMYQALECQAQQQTVNTGNSLMIMIGGSDTASYPVSESALILSSNSLDEISAGAAYFSLANSGGLTAASGTVAISAFNSSQVEGTYSVTLDQGLVLQGRFSAPSCAGLDSVAVFVPVCTTQLGTMTSDQDNYSQPVTEDCACKGKTTHSDCDVTWPLGLHAELTSTCSCVDASGTTSQCTADSEDGSSCCPLNIAP